MYMYVVCRPIFGQMEETGVLDVNDQVDLLALHIVYLPRIQSHLDQFAQSCAHRPLRTERSRTPFQLWSLGCAVDQRNITEEGLYGVDIDYNMSHAVDEEGGVEIPENPLDYIRSELNINACAESSEMGVQ